MGGGDKNKKRNQNYRTAAQASLGRQQQLAVEIPITLVSIVVCFIAKPFQFYRSGGGIINIRDEQREEEHTATGSQAHDGWGSVSGCRGDCPQSKPAYISRA